MNDVFSWLLGIGVLALALTLFLILFASCEVGFQLGRRRGVRRQPDDQEHAVAATLTSAMAALLAFILGLSVNYAQGRFEARRDFVVAESNAISSAWHRAREFGGPEGNAIADQIAKYVETRIEFTSAEAGGPIEAIEDRAAAQQKAIWRLTEESAGQEPTPIKAVLIIALNQMFDAAQSQRFAFTGEPPGAMLDMMLAGSMIAIGAMGFEMGLRGRRQMVLTCLLLVMWSGAMLIVVEFNRPRVGFVRADPTPLEWTLQEIRSSPPPVRP